MVEEHSKEVALRGIHPVLPSLALAFSGGGGDRTRDRGCWNEVV